GIMRIFRSQRPNQLAAIWVRYSPLEEEIFPLVLRAIDTELVTSRGIRSLSPRDPRYKGVYEGSQIERDLAYHQGCNHPFLLAPYIEVSFRVKGPSFWKRAEWLVEGFWADLSKHGVGAFSEIYDGDPPHEPHGTISSALSTSALLTVYSLLEKYKEA
ncbi:MAG: amylo-alpha-1,6-glucosidase, partial [Bacteroidales bacterium]|nr:amylo-alpha-1,6-glucosidase [Bacteroidales bacterium]